MTAGYDEDDELLDAATGRFVSGIYLSENAAPQAARVLVVAIGQDIATVDRLVRQVAETQLHTPTFKPVFLLASAPVDTLRHYSFQYETVMSPEAVEVLDPGSDYRDYLRRRVQEMRRVYRPHEVVAPRLDPDGHLGAWAP